MGHTGVQRRVYLRELVARFGHHLAVTWNLGEETALLMEFYRSDRQPEKGDGYLSEVDQSLALHCGGAYAFG
jgi:hypothetical protein